MKSRLFHTKLGGTTACAVCMSQGTCQTDLHNKIEVVKGDMWFRSVKTILSIKEHCP
jgi:positive regulator of sigma E activity